MLDVMIYQMIQSVLLVPGPRIRTIQVVHQQHEDVKDESDHWHPQRDGGGRGQAEQAGPEADDGEQHQDAERPQGALDHVVPHAVHVARQTFAYEAWKRIFKK